MHHRIVSAAGILALVLACDTVNAQRTLPLGLDETATFIPDDNRSTPEKIALGKQFFWDKRWSKSGTVACVSCHQPDHGWTDAQRFSTNFAGKPTPRRAPTLVNRLFSDRQLWTGLRATLEDQARHDGNVSDDTVVAQLGAIRVYQEGHRQVFRSEERRVGKEGRSRWAP